MKKITTLLLFGLLSSHSILSAQSDANIGRMGGNIGSGVSSGGGLGNGGGNWSGNGSSNNSGGSWNNNNFGNSSVWNEVFTGSGQVQTYTRPSSAPNSYEQVQQWEREWLRMGDKALTTSLLLNPPFQGVDVPVQSFRFDASKGAKLELPNGSVIEVPKAAFMDKAGKPVAGEVQLDYREFHNAADIIASGIPMHDVETGQYFETAGMFEIGAEQNGQELLLHPDKSVKVKMASYNEGNDFDFWSYNPETGNWREQDGAGQVPAQRLRRGGDANRDALRDADLQANLSRSFSISTFGIHNWDRMTSALRNTGGQSIEFIFDEQAKDITNWNNIPFFFVTRNGRAVIGHSRQSAERVRFEPYSSDALVAILPGNRVAVFTGSDYGKMDRSGNTIVYRFKTAAQPIESVAQLAQVLKLQ